MPHDSARPSLQVQCFGNTASFVAGDTSVTRQSPCQPPIQELLRRAAKLDALTTLIAHGDPEGFDCFDDSIKSNLLDLISDLASEVHALALLSEEHRRAKGDLHAN